MATSPASPIQISEDSEKAFIAYYKTNQDAYATLLSSRREYFLEMDKQYQREKNKLQENEDAKAANKRGDASRYQDITVPVVMPQVEAAVTYQTSVFLTGYPIFGVVSSPEYMDEAMMLESKIEDDSIKGGWARQLILFFRDGFKYNFAPLEVTWTDQVTSAVETDLTVNTSQGIPTELLWSGNKVKRWNPYNTSVDPRVSPSEVYSRGEWASHTEFMSRIELKELIASLPDRIIRNIVPAFNSNSNAIPDTESSYSFYSPQVNDKEEISERFKSGTDWLSWAGLSELRNKNISYKDSYEVTTLYCKILPSEFGLVVPKSSTPQIYKLLIVNHEYVIYAEKQTNAHNFLPVLIGQPLEDGLDYQTKSLAENATPFQEVTTAYMVSILESRRRAISDRTFYDPARIASHHINSTNPSAKIPVRPGAYNKSIQDAVYSFPYREDQASNSMQQIQTLLGLANSLAGQNRVSQGQFQKGNKTLSEFEETMQNANGRDQLASILLEHQVFTAMKFILKLNVLQYEGGTEIYNREKRKVIEIDPLKLRKAVLEFKVSDGIIPSSKIINGEAFGMSLQTIASSPQIGGAYNIGPMFSYLMKTQGADLSPFEKSQEQLAYEQAVQAWQQAVMFAIEKGAEIDEETGEVKGMPPQPLPQQFNYDPSKNNPSPQTEGTNVPATTPQG